MLKNKAATTICSLYGINNIVEWAEREAKKKRKVPMNWYIKTRRDV